MRFQRGPGPGGRPLGLRVRVGSVGDHQRGATNPSHWVWAGQWYGRVGGGSRSLIGGMGVVGTGGCREASGDIVGGQSDCLLCTDTCRGHEEGHGTRGAGPFIGRGGRQGRGTGSDWGRRRGRGEGRPGGSATDIIHTHTTAVVVGMLGGQWRDQCTVKKGGGLAHIRGVEEEKGGQRNGG